MSDLSSIDKYVPAIRDRFETLRDKDGALLYGNKSHLYHVLRRLQSVPGATQLAAEKAVQIVSDSSGAGKGTAAAIALNLGKVIGYISGYSPNDPPKITDKGICSMGVTILDWFAKEGMVTAKKVSIDNGKTQWFILPKGDFAIKASEDTNDKLYMPLNNGPWEWTSPILMYEGYPIELVKRSTYTGLLHTHTQEAMPEVYEAVNRANRQEWIANSWLLDVIDDMAEDNPFLPEPVVQAELDQSKSELANLPWKRDNFKFFMLDEVLKEADLSNVDKVRIADNAAVSRFKDFRDAARSVISAWDKQQQFYKIVTLANMYEGDVLNFCYSYDSRGRMYANQPHYNPLSTDLAKALLLYNDYLPVNLRELSISTANLMGFDKATLDERVKFVDEHMTTIIRIGESPWDNIEALKDLEVGKKDFWQFLVAAREWFMISEHLAEGNDLSDYRSNVPNARDGTNQAIQILSLIGGDEFCGPKVNVAAHYDEDGNQTVGDAYAYIGGFIVSALDGLEDPSDTLKAFTDALRDHPKRCRVVAKRNTMTKNYSGTRWGFGVQHWEDKDSYAFEEAEALTYSDCFVLGGVVFDIIETQFKKASELMEWMKEGITLMHSTDPILTWKLPDGFTAFADKYETTNVNVSGNIGDKAVSLLIHIRKNKINKRKHRNAVAPNFIHSLDAYILREILRWMPEDAPISTVHDSFSTTSDNIPTLIEVGREAYKKATDREQFRKMCNAAFKVDRELPEAGSLEVDSLNDTPYFLS